MLTPALPITRRSALALMGLAAFPIGTVSGAEVSLSPWTGHELRIPMREGAEKPPIVTALAVDPAGQQVAIAGDDHLLRIWNVAEKRFTAEIDVHQDWIRAVSYSPDGSLLASAGNDGRTVIWNVGRGDAEREFSQELPVTHLAFGTSGGQLATVGFRSPLRLFDLASGVEVRALACPCADMRAVAASPDNRYLAAGGRNGKIRIWEIQSGDEVHEFDAHSQRIRALQFAPDSKSLASCSDDRTVRVSYFDGQEPLVLRCSAKVLSLTYVGPLELAAGSSDNVVRIWDLATSCETSRLVGHTGSVSALAYSGDTLASAGYDTIVRLWLRSRNIAKDGDVTPRRVGRRNQAFDAR